MAKNVPFTIKRTAAADKVISTDTKRFYAPGVIIESKCPVCGRVKKRDLGDSYLGYPHFNAIEKVSMSCEASYGGVNGDIEPVCNTDWTVEIVLRLSVEKARS